MATGGRLRDSDVPDIYSCAVCMEHLLDRIPRFLFCHHSFCQQCLQKLSNNGQVSCPTCRAVTAVPNNDVTKLTRNFQLLQMIQHLKQERQLTVSFPKCLFCGKEQATYKCRECKHCGTKHSKMKTFKSHVILGLCHQHLEGISHVCMQCVQALCIKCIVLDHEDHEDLVEEYNEGMEKLKSELEKMGIKLKERTYIIQKHQHDIGKQKRYAVKKVKRLQMRRDALVKQIEEIDKELVNATDKVKKFTGDVKIYSDLSDKCAVTSQNVTELVQSSYEEILHGFFNQERLIEQLLGEACKLQTEYTFMLDEKVEWLVRPLFQTEFCYLGGLKMKHPTNIKTIEPDLFVYSDYDTSRFVVFNDKGSVKRCFEGLKEYGSAKCVDVYNNNVYLTQEKQIICIENFNTRKETKLIFVPEINKIFKMVVSNDNILICTDFEEGRVYMYNTEDDTTKMVLQGLGHPSYISVDHTPQGIRYILSLEGQFVKIYNESWQLLTTVTQNIKDPYGTAPCPGGFLLADNGSNQITLYSYTGDLVRTVLTKEDGLDGPTSLTLNLPYMWVAESALSFGNNGFKFNGKIKCFKFQVDAQKTL